MPVLDILLIWQHERQGIWGRHSRANFQIRIMQLTMKTNFDYGFQTSILCLVLSTMLGIETICVRSAAAQQEAPFGFTWGQTLQDIQSMNLEIIQEKMQWTHVHRIDLKNAPITPDDTDQIILMVDPKFGLGRIIWISNVIKDDIFGSKGKEKYVEISSLLSSKYGTAQTIVEHIGLELYRDDDEFYECLAYSGCGIWVTSWQIPDGAIVVQLRGLARGTGYLGVTYEGPNWQEILDALKEKSKAKAQKAF